MSKRKNPETTPSIDDDADKSPAELVASDTAETPDQQADEPVMVAGGGDPTDVESTPDADATDTVDEAAQPSEVETVAGAEAEETPAYRGKLPPDPDAEENQGIPLSARIAAERDKD